MVEKVRIRRADADDVIELAQLLRRAAKEQAEDIFYPAVSLNKAKQLLHILTLIDQGFVVVAEEKDEISGTIFAAIGCSIGCDDWSDQWMINNEWTYVHTDWRNTDVADQLMTAVENFADSQVNPETGQGLPILMGVLTGRGVDLKDKLMSRRNYQYGGGNFLRAPRDVRKSEDIDTGEEVRPVDSNQKSGVG